MDAAVTAGGGADAGQEYPERPRGGSSGFTAAVRRAAVRDRGSPLH